jgi:hypothetical protein
MRVLVACEYSGVVREAFRRRGHDAWSCDFEPAEDNSPYHLQQDVLPLLHDGWDLMVAHPPCTFLANSSNKHLYLGMKKENGPDPERWENMRKGAEFFLKLWHAPIKKKPLKTPSCTATPRK